MLRDIHLAIRRFWFTPARTALMILIVGLGIGASTAVFSVVDQTILRPPPFAHADRLVQVLDLYRSAGARSTTLTLEKITGWQEQHALFEAFEGYTSRQFDLTGETGEPERLRGFVVTPGLFRMLGVQPLLGREFTDADGGPGAERVVVISEALWRRRFGRAPQVLGKEVMLSDRRYTIVGVMPRRFRLTGDDEHVWVPVAVRTAPADTPSNFIGLGRLAPGVARGTEQSLADTLASRMQSATPLPREPFWDIWLTPKKVAAVADTTRTALFVLLGAVGFVLLITCANIASLFLSQIANRQREMAIRTAIGASRRRLFREVLTESVLLAACGGAVGILLATWGVDAIVAAAPPNFTYYATSPIEVDGRILAVAAATTLVTGLMFGLVPAFRGSAADVEIILKSASGTGRQSLSRGWFSGALVIAEVAFSVILLVGAALMVRTFANLHALERGFEPNGLTTAEVSLPTDKYVGEASRSGFFEAVRERLMTTPGVSDVSVAAGVFGGGGIHFAKVEVAGDTQTPSNPVTVVPSNRVTSDYFRTMRIPLLAGRTFTEEDAPDAVVISRSFADRFWPNGDAVGSRFRLGANFPWETVAGVVGDVQARATEPRTSFHIYRRFAPAASTSGNPPAVRGYATRVILVRASSVDAAVSGIRAAVSSLDRNQPISRVTLVGDLYADAFARERFVLQLMSIFGALAVVLTAAGIFGLVSQNVARRTREIGVRLALGARAADILRLVLSRGFLLVGMGTALGLAAAVALSRFLEALLFQVSPIDPVSFALVTPLLLSVALLACWIPTRRAIRVDPAVALRVE